MTTNTTCASVPKRFPVITLLSLGMLCIHIMRTNLGIAEVAIVESFVASKRPSRLASSINATTPLNQHSGASVLTGPNVGILNSALYVGLVLAHTPGGFVSMRFETRWVFVIGSFLSATINNFVPVLLEKVVKTEYEDAVIYFWATTALRVIQGSMEAALMPAGYALMGKWVPQMETSRYGSLVFAGIYGGPVIGYLIGAVIISFDWRAIFWLTSGLVYAWCIVFTLIVYESPLMHPGIQEAETKLIHDGYRLTTSGKNIRIPWRDILTSWPVWSLCACNFARNWTYYFLLTSQALYFKNFDFDHSTNGYLSMIPHILLVTTVFLSGVLADKFGGYCTTTHARKLFNTVGFLGSGLFFMCLAFAEEGDEAVGFLSAAVGLFGFSASGWQVNHLDLAPAFSSVLVGMSVTIGTVGGVISPLLIGFLVTPHSLAGWHLMFGLTAGLLCSSAMMFLWLGSGERQPWAVPQDDSIPLQTTAASKAPFSPSLGKNENAAFDDDNNKAESKITGYGSIVTGESGDATEVAASN